MYNDPPQYQPGAYEQTQVAPPLQPGRPGQNPPPSSPRPAGNPWLKPTLIAGAIIVVMLAIIAGVAIVSSMLHSPSTTVSDYYAAVKQQDYNKAYGYVRIPGTTGSQGVRLYVAVAQALDKARGPVSSYSEQSHTVNGDSATVVETVQRNGASYTVQLVLKHINGEWRIATFTTV